MSGLENINPNTSRERGITQRLEAISKSVVKLSEIDSIGVQDLLKKYEKLLEEQHALFNQANYIEFRDFIAKNQDAIMQAAEQNFRGRPDAYHLVQDLVQNVNVSLLRYGQKYPDQLRDLIDPKQPLKIKDFLKTAVKNKALDTLDHLRRNPLYKRNEIFEEGLNPIGGEISRDKLPQFVDMDQEGRIIDKIDRESNIAHIENENDAEIIFTLDNQNLIRALGILREPDRKILLLRLWGLENNEIAKRLEINNAVADQRIHRAQERLKKILASKDGSD